uniref:Capsid protein n=1 Tax=Murine feces-associated hepe-like virus TaxID=2171386 RepID=A0A2S0SZ27_9VIRU|nr:putative capsid protein [Murine feces-associated hepe-like virus]
MRFQQRNRFTMLRRNPRWSIGPVSPNLPRGVMRNVQRRGVRSAQTPPKRGETVISDRMYVGTLTSAGIKIPVGPDPTQFSGESLVTRASTFNQYRVLSATLHYQPLLNQTNGNSIVNVWLTSDPKDNLPTEDRQVKVTMTSAKGISWFATYSRNYKPILPQTQLYSYPTGAGGIDPGSDFQAAHYFMIKPTSADASITNYGEVYISMTISVSSPMPAPAKGQPSRNDIALNTWVNLTDTTLRKFLFHQMFGKYMAVQNEGKINVYETIPDVEFPHSTSALTFFTNTIDAITKPQPNNEMGNHYKWNAEAEPPGWEDLGPIATSKIYTTYNISPTVLKTIMNTVRQQLIADIQPTRLYNTDDNPMEKRIGDEEDYHLTLPTTTLIVNSKSEPLTEENFVPVQIESQPVSVSVTQDPLRVSVENTPGVNVKNQLETIILEQPIATTSEKSMLDTIGDLAGAILPLLIKDGQHTELADNLTTQASQ